MTFFWTNLNICSHGRCVCETDSLFVKKISQVQKIQPLVLVKYFLCRPCQVFISMEIIPPPGNEVEERGYIAFTLCAVCSSACLSVPRLLTRLSTHAVGNRCIDCSESLWTHYSISEDVHLEFFYPLDNHSLFYKIFSFFFYFFITRNPVLKIMKIFYLNIEKCVAVVVGDVVELKLYIYFYDLQ